MNRTKRGKNRKEIKQFFNMNNLIIMSKALKWVVSSISNRNRTCEYLQSKMLTQRFPRTFFSIALDVNKIMFNKYRERIFRNDPGTNVHRVSDEDLWKCNYPTYSNRMWKSNEAKNHKIQQASYCTVYTLSTNGKII